MMNQKLTIRRFLRNYQNAEKDDRTVGAILVDVAAYYEADRAYILELNAEHTRISSVFEWCAEGVTAQMENIRDIPLAHMNDWFQAFEEKDEFYIRSLSDEYDSGTQTYRFLESQGVKSLMAAPIVANEEIVGLLGVDNPHRHIGQFLFLTIAASVSYSAITVKRKLDAAIKEESMISKALSMEYSSLFKLDGQTGRLSLYRTDGIAFSPQLLAALMDCEDPDVIMRQYIDSYVVPEDRERLTKMLQLENLRREVPDTGLYVLGYRRILEGTVAYFELHVAKIVDENGKDTFILGFRNVDAEMRRQLRLTREMELQQDMLAGLSSEYFTVLLVDLDSDTVTDLRSIEGHTEEIAERLGRGEFIWSQMLEDYIAEAIAEDCREVYRESMSIEALRARKEDYSVVTEALINGQYRFIQLRIAYVYQTDGRRMAVIGTRSIDDVIRKERQQEAALKEALDAAEVANKAKTNFLSNMSHDMRTPLNGIVGLLELNERHADDVTYLRENRRKAAVAADHLRTLINDVLDMAKIEDGSIELANEPFNLCDKCNEAMTILMPQAQERGIDFKVNFTPPEERLIYLYGSPLHLCRAMMNIIGNCIKYNRENGSVTVDTQVIACDAQTATYRWTITDTGIGMSQAFVERIFEPFVQEAADARSVFQGTGLGMSISKALIEKMGGTLEVSSQEGVGSTFVVTVPFVLAPASEVVCAEQVQEVSIRGMRILLAEDNTLNREIAEELLTEKGALVTSVVNGREAVKAVADNPPGTFDLVLMDIMMPVMDGYEATRCIRRLERADAATLPIVAMTAKAFSEDVKRSLDAGMNTHLSKPLDIPNMMRTIGQYRPKT